MAWFTCGLTACTPGLAPGPTLGNEYGRTLPFIWLVVAKYEKLLMVCLLPPTETPLQFFISVSADLLSTSANVSVFNLLSWYYSHQLLIHFSLSQWMQKRFTFLAPYFWSISWLTVWLTDATHHCVDEGANARLCMQAYTHVTSRFCLVTRHFSSG